MSLKLLWLLCSGSGVPCVGKRLILLIWSGGVIIYKVLRLCREKSGTLNSPRDDSSSSSPAIPSRLSEYACC